MDEAQSPPESPVREGDILAGKYRVEKVLGVGGMGVVVAAMHTELDERVALKFLRASAAQNPSVVARFNREARAAAKIKSQHVARVIDVGTLEDGTPYIVMEYLDGKDLADILLEGGPLSPGVAVDYVLQACEAIAEAHAVGFVHRDLKPPNLFLAQQSDGRSIVKVLDFGISKAIVGEDPAPGRGALTGTTEIFGSPTYMSPEQLRSARDVDARADIWAIGVILYELVSGVAPFDRPTVPETFGAILFEEPAPLSKYVRGVPDGLEKIIFRCLAKDRDARLTNVGALAKALFPFAASGSQASLERTSRVLRRAGITTESVAPPRPDGGGPQTTGRDSSSVHSKSSPGSQTRTAWDTASQIPGLPAHPRSRTPILAGILAGTVFAATAGIFWIRQARPTPAAIVPVVAERAGHDGGDPQTPGATALPGQALPPPAVTATPSVVVQAPMRPAPAVAATVATVATATPGPMPSAPPHGKLPGHKGKTGAPAGTGAPSATPATPTPTKPPEDDFNDRK
jgi:serine/threonine-protein kinase